jgi:hypothetical protein
LAEFYLDIETVPLEQYRLEEKAGTDPAKAKIITIQYQRLDGLTGQPIGQLQILRDWEPRSSEEVIVKTFQRLFANGNVWDFVQVGNNLLFECKFLKHKLRHYCGLDGLKLGQRPMIDLKHTLVIANNGMFKGYDSLLGKSDQAENMTMWYYDKNWSMIEQYIRQEAHDFRRTYCILKRELPRIQLH